MIIARQGRMYKDETTQGNTKATTFVHPSGVTGILINYYPRLVRSVQSTVMD
ncbi:hypothetical protein LR48_Vigan09g013400 [Vigna angularis]|uniref:Uncharacterized protein n=1 Tax=Phaseolus angularis TaxID=3914 RepID=A0A0L9V8S2_PHAAN|nr:hypothetical protein LR48_Vigan09g013400 [Vigna angularis]